MAAHAAAGPVNTELTLVALAYLRQPAPSCALIHAKQLRTCLINWLLEGLGSWYPCRAWGAFYEGGVKLRRGVWAGSLPAGGLGNVEGAAPWSWSPQI